MIGGFARLAPDGHAVALLGSSTVGNVSIWSEGEGGRGETVVKLPTTFKETDSYVLWSPSIRAALYAPSFTTTELFVVDSAGVVSRESLGADLMHIGLWRNDDEITIVTAKPQTFPLHDATLWSWRPPARPTRMAGPLTLSTYPRWSPDGRNLATIEGDPAGRSVHLRGTSDRVLASEPDLIRGLDGCLRYSVDFSGVSWSPDSLTVAILGRGGMVILTKAEGGRPSVFAAPDGSGCYVPGRLEWSGSQAVVPLYGPDCGPTANGLTNMLALVDSKSAVLDAYVPISRKGLLRVSGRWVAIAAPTSDQEATTFFSLDVPGMRVTVPLHGLADYCCAP